MGTIFNTNKSRFEFNILIIAIFIMAVLFVGCSSKPRMSAEQKKFFFEPDNNKCKIGIVVFDKFEYRDDSKYYEKVYDAVEYAIMHDKCFSNSLGGSWVAKKLEICRSILSSESIEMFWDDLKWSRQRFDAVLIIRIWGNTKSTKYIPVLDVSVLAQRTLKIPLPIQPLSAITSYHLKMKVTFELYGKTIFSQSLSGGSSVRVPSTIGLFNGKEKVSQDNEQFFEKAGLPSDMKMKMFIEIMKNFAAEVESPDDDQNNNTVKRKWKGRRRHRNP